MNWGNKTMSKKDKEIKTNAMRILDKMKISYEHFSYEAGDFIDGKTTAEKLGLPFELVYKTLVAKSGNGDYFVFVVPIEKELDLKAAAKSVGVKSVEMIHVRDLTAVTGYVRGGCTSVGMKKQYVTRVDNSAEKLDFIYVSAGKIGVQLKLSPYDLIKANQGEFADICERLQ